MKEFNSVILFVGIASQAIIDNQVSRVKRRMVAGRTQLDWSVTVKKDGLKTSLRTLRVTDIKCETTEVKEIYKHLQNVRNVLLYTNATPIRCHTGLGYGCAFCAANFLIPGDLKRHTLEEHDDSQISIFMKGTSLTTFAPKLDITTLHCELCDTEIFELEQLLIHLKTEHDKEIYTEVNNHMIPFKFDSEVLKCAICEKEFQYFKHILEHMSFHYRNYLCTICNAPFTCIRGLKTHLTRHKRGEFPCSICSKVFDTKFKRNDHEKFVHIRDHKRSKCPYCSEKFTRHEKKMEHMAKEHGEKPLELKCKACSLTFKGRDALTRHTKRDHLMERQHQCQLCDMKFYSKAQLNGHMIAHSSERNFRCDICMKAYARKKTLREHMRIHQDDRRFKCEVCGQTFIQKCSLKSHLKSKHWDRVC